MNDASLAHLDQVRARQKRQLTRVTQMLYGPAEQGLAGLDEARRLVEYVWEIVGHERDCEAPGTPERERLEALHDQIGDLFRELER